MRDTGKTGHDATQRHTQVLPQLMYFKKGTSKAAAQKESFCTSCEFNFFSDQNQNLEPSGLCPSNTRTYTHTCWPRCERGRRERQWTLGWKAAVVAAADGAASQAVQALVPWIQVPRNFASQAHSVAGPVAPLFWSPGVTGGIPWEVGGSGLDEDGAASDAALAGTPTSSLRSSPPPA
eukprot:1157711-Pelagomonas_calceolata.AAC.15